MHVLRAGIAQVDGITPMVRAELCEQADMRKTMLTVYLLLRFIFFPFFFFLVGRPEKKHTIYIFILVNHVTFPLLMGLTARGPYVLEHHAFVGDQVGISCFRYRSVGLLWTSMNVTGLHL